LRLITWLNEIVYHNLLIRFFIESYLQIVICAYINFSKIQLKGPLAISFSSIFSLIILGLAVIMIFHNYLVHRLLHKLPNALDTLKSFSAYFDSLKYPFPSKIDNTTWFLLRRFLFAAVIVQLSQYPVV
jgi:hypothetical protein